MNRRRRIQDLRVATATSMPRATASATALTPCFRNDTIIYHENNGTEDSVTKEYKETDVLPEYDALFNGSTHADMKFAGWSTKQKPTRQNRTLPARNAGNAGQLGNYGYPQTFLRHLGL